MANPEHLAILGKGVSVWNEWRLDHPDLRPDLSEASLVSADLSKINLGRLSRAENQLQAQKLNLLDKSATQGSNPQPYLGNIRKQLAMRALIGLVEGDGANLYHADLTGAQLRNANLVEADLSWAHLSGANLVAADLTGARLCFAELIDTDLRGAELWQAEVGWTKFGNTDLRTTDGLFAVTHVGPSTIGIDTVVRSQNNIPAEFLRGAGVPDQFISFIESVASSDRYSSCFISYSSKDEAFARQLYFDLQQHGVRCWFAPENLKIGDAFRQRIDDAIRVSAKLLLILSSDSLKSRWVQDEVELCLEREHAGNRPVLVPVRVDDSVMRTDSAWAASIRRQRHIGDFSAWKDRHTYRQAVTRLMRDLRSGTSQVD